MVIAAGLRLIPTRNCKFYVDYTDDSPAPKASDLIWNTSHQYLLSCERKTGFVSSFFGQSNVLRTETNIDTNTNKVIITKLYGVSCCHHLCRQLVCHRLCHHLCLCCQLLRQLYSKILSVYN